MCIFVWKLDRSNLSTSRALTDGEHGVRRNLLSSCVYRPIFLAYPIIILLRGNGSNNCHLFAQRSNLNSKDQTRIVPQDHSFPSFWRLSWSCWWRLGWAIWRRRRCWCGLCIWSSWTKCKLEGLATFEQLTSVSNLKDISKHQVKFHELNF